MKYNTIKPLDAKLMNKYFKGLNMASLDVNGDGSCFFHSLAALLNIHHFSKRTFVEQKQIGHRLRRKVYTHLLERGKPGWKRFWTIVEKYGQYDVTNVPTYEEIKEKFANTSAWAESSMIVYSLTKLRVNFIFFDEKQSTVYPSVIDISKHRRPLVMILWKNHVHFEPIVERVTNKKVRKLFYPSSLVFKHIKKSIRS
jgi:hypothetical protein